MKVLVIAKYKLRGRALTMMQGLMGDAFDDSIFVGVETENVQHDDFSKAALKQMREDFQDRFNATAFDAVLALGNEALYVTTGHSGIMKWRGKEMAIDGCPMIASIAPGAVERNPSQADLLQADISALFRMVTGEKVEGSTPQRLRVVSSRSMLQHCLEDLANASAVAYDLETSGFDELAPDAFIVSMAMTIRPKDGGDDQCWVVPLCHRASVWNTKWQRVLQILAEGMRKVPTRIGHNAKFDCRWLVQFDAPVPANFDTMLAANLLNENRDKGLKKLARVLLDAPEWDIQIKGGKRAKPWYEQHPLRETLKYNALDTWHTMRLYYLFRRELAEDPRVLALFNKLIMPASQSLVHIERRGVYVDRELMLKNAQIVNETLERIENELTGYVPDNPPHPINWNPSTFLRWFLFEECKLPVIEYTKSGMPSTSEESMMHLAEQGYPMAKLLLERVKWQKFRSGFFNPYQELITPESRLHTTFKLAGTVTGRLSSGKADDDKVTAKATIRGVNLQQVPRDPLVRGIFGAAPGWTFIEADYSQVELRIAAEVAQERTMLSLYARGEDIHMTMAMRMTGKPASEVTKEERKKAKAVNFGFLYGMGWRKFIQTAYSNYGVTVTEAEAKAFRTAFFDQFPDLMRWHARQRRLAHKYKRVQSPLGRLRHLPDIDSLDPGVVSEAERQAINSPVQAMASDLCLLSLSLLDRKFRKAGLRAAPIGTVHDAINFECPDDELEIVIPMIKDVMEHPPTRALFGYELKVPIVADVAVGSHWGHKEEIPGGIVTSQSELRQWLNER